MSVSRRLALNVGALTLARGVTAVLNLVTFAYLARMLEPKQFGVLGVGFSMLAYAGLLVNLGLSLLGTREIARTPARMLDFAAGILGLRLVLLVFAFGGYLGGVALLELPFSYKVALVIQGLTLVGQAIALDWVYQGIERMGVLALRNVAVAMLSLGGAFLLVQGPTDLVAASLVVSLAVVLANGWLLLTFRRDFGVLRLRGRVALWGPWIRSGLPLLATLSMYTIYTHTATLLLGTMRGEVEAGWYTAAFKVMGAAIIPLDIFLQAFLPSLSSAVGDLNQMRTRGRHFAHALLVVGLPVTLVGILHAMALMDLFYGAAYRPGGATLALLMVSAFFHYLNTALGNPLIAWDRERWYMGALMLGAAVSVVLNVALIPHYGASGAAAATAACQASVLGALAVMHYRVVQRLYLGVLLRVGLAAVGAVGLPALIAVRWDWPFGVAVAVSAALYAGAVIGFRIVDVPALLRGLRGAPSGV